MATNIIPSATSLSVIPASNHNALKEALGGDLVPRNASGVPVHEGGDIGTSIYGFKDLRVRNILATDDISTSGSLGIAGTISGVTSQTMSGSLSGGTTATFSGNISSTGGDVIANGNLSSYGARVDFASDGHERIIYNGTQFVFAINNANACTIGTGGVETLANSVVTNTKIADQTITGIKRATLTSSIGLAADSDNYINTTGAISSAASATWSVFAGRNRPVFISYEITVTHSGSNTLTMTDSGASPTTIISQVFSGTQTFRGVYFHQMTANSTITLATSSVGSSSYSAKIMAVG